MKIIRPQKLNQGDVVGIVSPSEPVTENLRAQFKRGLEALHSFGVKTKLAPHVFEQHYYNAGTAAQRVEDFNGMWRDPQVKMILMSQGGETANHLLAGIDYEMIKHNPKIFAGISDGTTLLNAIFAKTGLVTYHGPDLLWTFGRHISEPFKENFINTLFHGEVGPLRPNPNWQHQEKAGLKHGGWRCLKSGRAGGILMGGHSGCLTNLLVAGFGPSFEGALLFLEGTDDVAHLDRQFTAFKLGGVFDKINGLVIGWFEDHELKDADKNREVRDVILEVLGDYSFPILEIGELGHNVENYLLPIGCRASIEAEKLIFSIDEPTVM